MEHYGNRTLDRLVGNLFDKCRGTSASDPDKRSKMILRYVTLLALKPSSVRQDCEPCIALTLEVTDLTRKEIRRMVADHLKETDKSASFTRFMGSALLTMP